jgi:hypothetical protein
MAYIAVTHGCCHCKECWNVADVPHGTLGVIFTVRESTDDGFERHVLPGGFKSKALAEAAFAAAKENP